MKAKVRLTRTVEIFVEGKSEEAIMEWMLQTTPEEAYLMADGGGTDKYDEEIVDVVDDNSVVDYIIPQSSATKPDMRGLKLFIADIVDEDTNEQQNWYIVGKTYESALKRFVTEANGCYARYSYYFDNATDEDILEFAERYDIGNIKAGIYEK